MHRKIKVAWRNTGNCSQTPPKAAVTKPENKHLQNIRAEREDKKELYKCCETTEEEYKR